MADTIVIETPVATVLEVSGKQGPQGVAGSVGATGPKGDKGDPGTGIETLTTAGDLLYRDNSAAARLPIGTSGQVLKVSSGGLPEWGAAASSGVTSVTGTAPIASSGGTTPAISINAATTSAAGSMSAADKSKLDGIAANATANSASSSTPSALGTAAAGSSSDYSRADHVHSSEVSDSAFRIIGSTDATKKVAIEVDANVPTASVVTLTAPASSGTLALGNQSVNDTDSPAFLGIYVGTDATNATNVGEVTITTSGLALSMEEPNGGQVSMRWFSPATTGDGNHWGFGCDTLNTNENNFFVWDFINNRPALWTNGATGNVVFGGEYAEGTLPAKVQVIGISPSTATLLGLDNKTAGAVAQKIRAAVSQSANLSEWLDSSGNLLLSVNSSGNLVLHDNVGGANTATFTASSQLTGNRSYNVPDASGTLALTSDIPALGTGAGEAAEGNHTHELTALAATGATNGHVLTANGSNGATFAALPSSGVTGAASSASDVLGVSGANITGVDANADRIVYWNNTSNKLAYGTPADAGAAAASHTHAASDITSGTINTARLASGTANSGTFLRGDQTWAAVSGVTTGSVDNAVLRADGTGGSTSQSSDISIEDATTTTANNVTISNQHSGQTNSSIVIQPKGTGAFILGPKPDGTTSGGNARGSYAVDLQLGRDGSNIYVASGTNALAGGYRVTASGNYSVGLGQQVTASSQAAFSVGQANTASNVRAACVGGVDNTASAIQAITVGGSRGLADRLSILAHSGGQFAATGDAQRIRAVLRCKTTTNAAVEMALDGSTTYLTIPSGKVIYAEIRVVGTKSDGSAVATYTRQYAAKNVAGTSSEVYAAVTIGTDNAASTSLEVATVDAGDYIRIRPTGIASETWRWVASVDAVEVAYGT